MIIFFSMSTNCNCCNIFIPVTRSELNALLCLTITIMMRGSVASSILLEEMGVTLSKSEVSTRAESLGVW
jgi:predicted DNA repair protein MutK